MRSDVAEEIRHRVSALQAAEAYGLQPDRGGFVHCPFHTGDNHGSLKLYPEDRGWHCFGCGAGGDVIDLVRRLFGLSFRQAVLRIDTDFSLGLTGRRRTREERSALLEARRVEVQKRARADAEYRAVAAERLYWWECYKAFAPPADSPVAASQLHPFYVEALRRLPVLDAWLDEYISIGR